MRKALVISALILVAGCSKSGASCGDILQPPQAYDHPPTFMYQVREFAYADMTAACESLGSPVKSGMKYYACNRTGGSIPPVIYLPRVDGTNITRADQSCLEHHEWGHMNDPSPGHNPNHTGWSFR